MEFDKLTEDYSRTPVPQQQTVNGFRIAAIIIGVVITVPVLVAGAEVGGGLGLRAALEAFVTGGILLAALGTVTAIVGARSHLSTYLITQFPFGVLGGKIVNLLLVFSLFGWYAVTAAIFGKTIDNAMMASLGVSIGAMPCAVIGSALMIVTTIFGFKALDKLSLMAVPLLIVMLTALVIYSLGQHSMSDLMAMPAGGMEASAAISVVVGSYILGVIILPDLTRYAKSDGHCLLACVLSSGIGLPLILFSAAIAVAAAGQPDLVILMLGFGVPALFLLVFATWTSNAFNLYASSLTLAAIVPRIPKWKLVIVSGVLGTLVAIANVTDYFIPFLITLGVTLPPVAGIYSADFFFVRRQKYDLADLGPSRRVDVVAMSTWLLSSLVGGASAHGMLPISTTIPSCDSILAAFLLYLAGKKMQATYGASRLAPVEEASGAGE